MPQPSLLPPPPTPPAPPTLNSPPFRPTLSAAPCLIDDATGVMSPGWRYDAPVTLDFGGAWVTAGAGRDPSSADLTVALDGDAIHSSEVALSQHPEREGVYTLVFAAAYWTRAQDIENPAVSFAAGAFVSPTHGPLGAFSDRVALMDCKLPTVARAILVQTRAYECASTGVITCPPDGLRRAAFVLEMAFSKPVFDADGGPMTDAHVGIYTVGGVATVAGTYVVQRRSSGRRRRLSEAGASEAGATRLSIAVELSAGATGLEVVKVSPREGAITSGRWYLSHLDADVVTAAGNVLAPFPSLYANTADASVFVTLGIAVVVFAGVSLLLVAFWLSQRKRRRNQVQVVQVSVTTRGWSMWRSRRGIANTTTTGGPGALKPQQKKLRDNPASADALAIAKLYAWLRVKDPQVELTGRWIDNLADATVDTLRGAQPVCALVPAVLKTAHVVHSNLMQSGRAPDDLEALRTLGKVLRDMPPPLRKKLLLAAVSLDTSAAGAVGEVGEAEATLALQRVREQPAVLTIY